MTVIGNGTPRYRVTIDTARKGEPRRQRRFTFDSLKAARDHVKQVRADVAKGTYAEPVTLTVEAVCVEYLTRCERGDHGRKPVRPRSLDGYREAPPGRYRAERKREAVRLPS